MSENSMLIQNRPAEKSDNKQKYVFLHYDDCHSVVPLLSFSNIQGQSKQNSYYVYTKLLSSYMFGSCARIIVRIAYKK